MIFDIEFLDFKYREQVLEQCLDKRTKDVFGFGSVGERVRRNGSSWSSDEDLDQTWISDLGF